ncbi:hypothetical protein HYT56_01450 [Candidatus Woesearchaeota archaeon]|nr:hypothetical protein [Candidatus Woesearchaeota archaeon]
MKIKNKFWIFAIFITLVFVTGQGCERNAAVEKCENYADVDGEKICFGSFSPDESDDLSFSENQLLRNSAENIELCENFEQESKQLCEDNYYFENAKKGNLDLCDKIINDFLREECQKL